MKWYLSYKNPSLELLQILAFKIPLPITNYLYQLTTTFRYSNHSFNLSNGIGIIKFQMVAILRVDSWWKIDTSIFLYTCLTGILQCFFEKFYTCSNIKTTFDSFSTRVCFLGLLSDNLSNFSCNSTWMLCYGKSKQTGDISWESVWIVKPWDKKVFKVLGLGIMKWMAKISLLKNCQKAVLIFSHVYEKFYTSIFSSRIGPFCRQWEIFCLVILLWNILVCV